MTIFKNCYDTTMGQVINTRPIEIAIREAIIKDSLGSRAYNVRDVGGIKPILITGDTSSETLIPLFAHPIKVKNSQDACYMCADVRFFVRKDTPLDNVEKSIKNVTEFNLAVSRLVLSMLWEDNQGYRLKNGFGFAGTIFAAWLSETISKNFALDFKDQSVLNVLALYYYHTLFVEGVIPEGEERDRVAASVIKASKMPSEFVFNVLDKAGEINSLEEFCQAVTTSVENVRLRSFNLAVLLTLVKNSWYGANGKEMIAVALEHPPTWIAVVWAATNERTFSSSLIARLCDRLGKRGAADEFNTTYRSVMSEYIQK